MSSSESDPPPAAAATAAHEPPFQPEPYTPANVCDVIAIEQLLARYCHLLDSDTTDAQSIADLFHPDGEVCPIYENDLIHKGHQAIRTWYAAYLEATRRRSRLRRHMISNSRIEIAGNRAWAFSILNAQGLQVEAQRLALCAGWYEDDLVRVADRWFFQRRRIALDFAWIPPSFGLCRNGAQVGGEETRR